MCLENDRKMNIFQFDTGYREYSQNLWDFNSPPFLVDYIYNVSFTC